MLCGVFLCDPKMPLLHNSRWGHIFENSSYYLELRDLFPGPVDALKGSIHKKIQISGRRSEAILKVRKSQMQTTFFSFSSKKQTKSFFNQSQILVANSLMRQILDSRALLSKQESSELKNITQFMKVDCGGQRI